jgi:hypothetical protein
MALLARLSRKGNNINIGEVLVSAAIVLIVSSVLLPVARVPRNPHQQLMAQLPQLAAGILAYATDNSERFPFQSSFDTTNNVWRWNYTAQVPAGWRQSTTDLRNREDALQWANSTQPYFQDWSLLESPGLPLHRWGVLSDYDHPRFPWKDVSFAYNGNLHSYPLSGVDAPERLPLLWHGYGRVSQEGAAYSSPVLDCRGAPSTCFYGQIPVWPGNASNGLMNSAWVYGRSAYFVSVDGTVRRQPLGAGLTAGETSKWVDPFTGYDANGLPVYYWIDNAGGYAWLFRPDYKFQSGG